MRTQRSTPAAIGFALGLVLVLAAPLATPAAAQGFGKNKVQYESLDWAVLETPHLRLHFYAEEESLARRLAAVSESICVEFDRRFRLEFRRPIPVLLYSTHHLFQQTNATPGLISEGTGGLTELIKGRVLIPHTGSWARLEWVTRHELAHAYMLEKIARVLKDHKRSQGYLPPLWFIEGLAEFCATTWDADAEGLMRDAVVANRAYPVTRSERITGTVLMYKEGQSFLLYLDEHFGRERVFDLLDNWWKAEDFESAFKLTYGRKLSEVDREWFAEVKRHYLPAVASTRHAYEVAERLTRRGEYNLGPRALPTRAPGDTAVRFCYFSARESGIELVLNEPTPNGKRRDVRLLRGGQTAHFESFHLFQNRPDASASGLIALSSKHGGRDALFIVDTHTRRVVRRLSFEHLVAINDPALAPGDSAVVFSAQDYGGRSDLYRTSWPNGVLRLERLTNDDFDDLDPDVSPDGRWVVFSSDRGGRDGAYSIFRLPLTGGVPESISEPPTGDDRQPVYSPDGRWLVFRSTRGGTSDLYVRPSEPSREFRRVTRMVGPVFDPDWFGDGKSLLFSGQDRVEFQAYRLAVDPETLKVELEEPRAPETLVAGLTGNAPLEVSPPAAPMFHTGQTRQYERRLGLDLIQNGFAIDPGLGAGGAGQIAISDILGNEQFYISLSNDADRFGDFWDGFEGGVTYINQGQRLNYGVGVFRLTQVYDADLDEIRREKRLGIMGLASYPFSKFMRIETSMLVRHASDHMLRNGEFKDVDLVSNFLSFVHDNTGWTSMGPSSGSRWIISTGFTRDMTSGAGDFTTLLGELRLYAQPLPVMVSATRVQAQSSFGPDAQRYYLGGLNTLRGYSRRSLSGLQTTLVQQEFRAPLLRSAMMALPMAWMLPTVSGAVFADAAWGWEDGGSVRHLGSAGFGFYLLGGYYPAIRWNYIWTTSDFQNFSRRPRTTFSIWYNF